MKDHKGYYTDDLKIYRSYIENPLYKPFNWNIRRYRMFVTLKSRAFVTYNGGNYVLHENQMLFTDCEAHSTVILSPVDDGVMKKLGIHMTSEPAYQSKKLFHKN